MPNYATKTYLEWLHLTALTLFLCCCPQLSQQQTSCPAGWNLLSGSCILVNTSVGVTWCNANRECAKLGAELVTNFDVISNLRITNSNKRFWVGVSDLANKRGLQQRDGWQFVNGRGIMINALSDPDGPWYPNEPNSEAQDCLMFNKDGTKEGLMDKYCTDSAAGFACELKPDPPTPTCGATDGSTGGTGRTRWVPQPSRPVGSVVNDEALYCWLEHVSVNSVRECAVLAGSRLFSRSFFFSSAQSRCRVLEFSDSQTSLDVAPNPAWVKYLRV